MAADPEHDQAWTEFVAAYSGILLHTCRSLARDRDAAMDGYAFVLEALREDCCRRLRSYTPDSGARFTTWLVVVTRRLLLDHYRRRYGRARSTSETRQAEHRARRRLEDLVAAAIDPEELSTSVAESPDASVRQRELLDALHAAIEALPPRDRLLLVLRFEDERPIREIAAMQGFPTVFHVYRRLGAVLTTLRRMLVQRGIDGADP